MIGQWTNDRSVRTSQANTYPKLYMYFNIQYILFFIFEYTVEVELEVS